MACYQLGAKLDRFRPDQFLVIESFAGNDVSYGAVGNNAAGQLTGQIDDSPLGGCMVQASSLPIESGGYTPAFRHAFKKASNFLFIDGRVQTMTPRDDVADHSTSYSPSNAYVRIGPSHMAMN